MTEPGLRPRRVADRFWLLAYGGAPLRPLIGDHAVGLGCAAGVLAELVLDEAIVLHPTVAPRSYPSAGGDRLCANVRAEIEAEPGQELRLWLRYLAAQSSAWVRSRLLLDGLLTETVTQVGRLRPTSCPVWELATMQQMQIQTELQSVLHRPGPVLGGTGLVEISPYVELATLAGLAQATHLVSHVVRPSSGQVEDWQARLPHRLPTLLSTVRVLLDEAVTR